MRHARLFSIAVFGVSLLGGTPSTGEPAPAAGQAAVADSPDAATILARMTDAYAALETYHAHGRVQTNLEASGTPAHQTVSFEVTLQKPGSYLITWNQMVIGQAHANQEGAVWSDGTQPYVYIGATQAFAKFEDDLMALSTATGVSGGAAHTLPGLFFDNAVLPGSVLSRMQHPERLADETVDDEPCYVLRDTAESMPRLTLWIAQRDLLLRRSEQAFAPQPDSEPAPEQDGHGHHCHGHDHGPGIPEMTDEQLDETLGALGQEPNAENREQMRAMVERSRQQLNTVTGTIVETHRPADADQVNAGAFDYRPPEGVPEKDSLFDHAFGSPQ